MCVFESSHNFWFTPLMEQDAQCLELLMCPSSTVRRSGFPYFVQSEARVPDSHGIYCRTSFSCRDIQGFCFFAAPT